MSKLFDNLLDIIKHTHSLGFIDAVKVYGENNETKLGTMATDKSVVMYGTMKTEIPELADQTVGLSRMAVLSGMLNFPPFRDKDAKVSIGTQNRNGVAMACDVTFNSSSKHTATYRFMSGDAVADSIKVPPFKGATWNFTITPSKDNLKDLTYFTGVLGSYEPVFTAVTNNGNLEFHIGSGASDKSIVPIASNIGGSLKNQFSWPLNKVLPILKLSDTGVCTMSFSDVGVMEITIDSGLGKYQYLLPARSK